MPKSRAGRLTYALIVCACLLLIGRNLYRRSLNEGLYEAVTKSDLPAVRAHIARHADVGYKHPLADAIANADGSPKTQSVREAARERARAGQKNADEIFCLLTEQGAAGPPVPSLEDACEAGSLRMLHFALEHGPPENAASLNDAIDRVLRSTYPAKDAAARRTLQRQMVQTLREHGAQITAVQAIQSDDSVALHTLLATPTARLRNADAAAALCEATQRSDWKTVQLLLAHGADVNAANLYGETPLIIAAQQGDRKMAEALLAARAKRDVQTKGRGTAWEQAELARHYDLARLHGATPDTPYATGDTPLMLAAQTAPDAVKLLLAHGADPNRRNDHGDTPLMLAARYGDVEAARLLLEKGAEVNARNKLGDTPLLFAAKFNLATIPLLLEHYADFSVKARSGYTVLAYARKLRKPGVVKLLETAGAKDE